MGIINNLQKPILSIEQYIQQHGFSGSYRPHEVTFLLQKVQMQTTDTREKEQLIQSGKKHYSEMISDEPPPSPQHLRLFEQAMQQGKIRLAHEVQQLAHGLDQQIPNPTQPIILVSFVRAGVPLGVLLYHALHDLGRKCQHYGISILRDRGIDFAALENIIALHGIDSLVFVDGWTGKGAISLELQRSLGQDPRFIALLAKRQWDILPLVTLADLGGSSWLTASAEDWLIPSSILGSTISGLISRSVCIGQALSADQINAENRHQWHGCMVYEHLKHLDYSIDFIDQINESRRQLPKISAAIWHVQQRKIQQQKSQQVIQSLAEKYNIQNLNRIKPGIAEATRAILRRVPEVVLFADENDADTALLRHLTQVTHTPTQVVGQAIAPYRAITLIQKLGEG